MTVDLKNSKIHISQFEIQIRYNVTQDLISKEKIFNHFENLRIYNCFINDELLTNKNWKMFKKIICKNCKNVLISNDKEINTKSRIVFNFNYDYIENLEMLSCHETDIDNVIPNIEDKLQNM
jgi:hypothetical protein